MQTKLMSLSLLCLAAIATGQTYKVMPESGKPQKGELNAKQAFDKALVWLKALDRDVHGELRLTFKTYPGFRAWNVVSISLNKPQYVLYLTSKSGWLHSFEDRDITSQYRPDRPMPKDVWIQDQGYVNSVRSFLKLGGYQRQVTPIKIDKVKGQAKVRVFVNDVYRGVPISENWISMELRSKDGAIFNLMSRSEAHQFAGTVRVSEGTARQKVKAIRPGEKPYDFRLGYSRPQSSKDFHKPLSETARPYYVARFREFDEVWIDAETGKVARDYRHR